MGFGIRRMDQGRFRDPARPLFISGWPGSGSATNRRPVPADSLPYYPRRCLRPLFSSFSQPDSISGPYRPVLRIPCLAYVGPFRSGEERKKSVGRRGT